MMTGTRRPWRSLAERDGDGPAVSADEFPSVTPLELSASRRAFLKAAGFTFAGAALAGCSRPPAEQALPFVSQPEGIVPGRPYFYASTCGGCSAGCGVLVKCVDGRPIKLEGLAGHPISDGGLCATGQASILGLYDSQRLAGPLAAGAAAEWDAVDRAIGERLDGVRRSGGAVRFLTGSVTSPTERRAIEAFLGTFADGRHVEYDAVSASAILDAHLVTDGLRVLPSYRFDRADVILGIAADFLGTWIAPVPFALQYRAGRAPDETPPRSSYHVQVESLVSLTGGRADRRYRLAPDQFRPLVAHLASRIATLAGEPSAEPPYPPPLPETVVSEIAARLWEARGRSLVVCGVQDVELQVAVNALNARLDNYGRTIDLTRAAYQRRGDDRALSTLLDELDAGQVDALFTSGVNPVYDLPDASRLADALPRVPLVVSFAGHVDETAERAHFICPTPHYLEAWGDAEPVRGLLTLTQPALRPLGSTRAVVASLASWLGQPAAALEILRARWQAEIHPVAAPDVPFDAFWDQAVHDGHLEVPITSAAAVGEILEVPLTAPALEPDPPADDPSAFALVLYPKVGLLDGRHAHNPWLQELPDPVSKVVWDNYATLSPATARRLGLETGDIVTVEVSDAAAGELPVLVQAGQHDAVIGVALGYGRKGTDRFADIGPSWIEARPVTSPGQPVGVNAAPWLVRRDGLVSCTGRTVRIQPTGRFRELACTQVHHTLRMPERLANPNAPVRPIARETTLAAFTADPTDAVRQEGHHGEPTTIWPEDHRYPGHHWAMVVDLNACTGCSACLIACQAENNVAVVGRDEVRRRREMHWIRIDRYYSGDDDDLSITNQPMMCQHCERAPCEVVCPVLATVHSSEGLSQQVYNRCVGTRYCANNCPYKVRRFNWFTYRREDVRENLVLNPDVVVRSRGVMEKCSFCVQRIEAARVEATRRGGTIGDGDVQTACQQSCPSRAIIFGDRNDPESAVAEAMRWPRHYRVLEELEVRPSVVYLAGVRNRTDGAGDQRG